MSSQLEFRCYAERPNDIPLLVWHFVQEFSRRNDRAIESIPSQTMKALVRYDWPGNIRELQNVIERAVIRSRGPVLTVSIAELDLHKRVTCSHDDQEGLDATLHDAEGLTSCLPLNCQMPWSAEQTERPRILE